jgi:regulator of ribonuclease activity B
MNKARIGNIYEIRTRDGLAYVQYTHDGKHLGDLVRILPGVHSVRPSSLAELAQQKELFYIFTALNQAITKKEIELVGNESVPEWAIPFPIMRKAGGRARDGRVSSWFIGQGMQLNTLQEMQRALHVRELTAEQRELSLVQIWPVSTICREIERGWRPERADELERQERESAEGDRKAQQLEGRMSNRFIDHYFYFESELNATAAGDRLREKGWSVEQKRGADMDNWLVLAKQPVPVNDISEIRAELEGLAEEFEGEYDGWGSSLK